VIPAGGSASLAGCAELLVTWNATGLLLVGFLGNTLSFDHQKVGHFLSIFLEH